VTRNVRTYGHFCAVARALERVGERWNLLVIRDLITGPKRFTDLMDRLGGREVWYRLTPAGADLGPVIGMLNWWGLRHAWRWPQAGEPLHAEHLLRSAIQAIDLATDDHEPARWHLRLDGTDYLAESNGVQWSVTASPPSAPADVTITATTQSLAALIFTGSDAGIDITGETGAAERFRRLIGTMAVVVQPV
jgi:DNA-binding HxlR family transcriptional regulator